MRNTLQQLEQYTCLGADCQIAQALGSDVRSLADYFGIWAVWPQVFQPLVENASRLDLRAHVAAQSETAMRERNERRSFDLTQDGVAVIPISGVTMKSVGSMQEGTSTVRVRQQLRAARQDSAVHGAMLVMDTPGGASKGNSDLAEEVQRFGQAKPIHAFAEDLVASAGVSVASQAARITANCPSCLYGGMGTFAVVVDSSERAEQLGLQVHVIRAGEFKGAGTPGTPITAEQLQEMQRTVDAINDAYLALVASGRNISQARVAAMADGRVHPASEAQSMGLIDAVGSFDSAYQALLGAITSGPGARPSTQSRFFQADDDDDEGDDEPPTDDDDDQEETAEGDDEDGADDDEEQSMAAVTLQALREAFPQSTAEWREQQVLDGVDMQQAAINYANLLQEQLQQQQDDSQQRREQPRRQQRAQPGAGLGGAPLTVQGGADGTPVQTGDPVEDFHARVLAICGAHPTAQARQQAVAAVARQDPQLHGAYLLATNQGSRKKQRLILEKLEEFEVEGTAADA